VNVLEAKGLTKRFGGLVAVNNVDFHINEGEIFGLIGPNGSGKSTLFNCISRVYPNDGGQVFFRGTEITNSPRHAICDLGVGRTYQGSRVFTNLSTIDNVVIGRHIRTRSGLVDALFRTPRYQREERESRQKAEELLKLVGLYERRNQLVRDLPYAARSIAGIAIALATEPTLLLLDEPVAGLNPAETMDIMALVKRLRDSGITVFLVEHNMRAVMSTCDRIMVINQGLKIAEGNPKEISSNKLVIEAYLGKGMAEQ